MNKKDSENVGSLVELFKGAISYFRNRSSVGLRTPRRSDGLSAFQMDYGANPFSGRAVRTTSESLEDIMMREGRMSREVWEQLRGLEYDSFSQDDDDDLADNQEYQDEFAQSSFASYYDFEEARAKRAREKQIVAAARQSNSNATIPATESAGVKPEKQEQVKQEQAKQEGVEDATKS